MPPPAGSRQPITLTFPAPLDHALLKRCITLHDSAGKPFPCTIITGTHEASLTFTPLTQWPDPRQLNWHILSALEDLAGNSLARPFQVDLLAPPPRRAPKLWIRPMTDSSAPTALK